MEACSNVSPASAHEGDGSGSEWAGRGVWSAATAMGIRNAQVCAIHGLRDDSSALRGTHHNVNPAAPY